MLTVFWSGQTITKYKIQEANRTTRKRETHC